MQDGMIARPVGLSERIGALDVLRGVAVCGILLMNIPSMGMSYDQFTPAWPFKANADWIAYVIQDVGFAGSMRGMFTLLFGAGMMIMLRDADEDGDAARPRPQAYLTRCFGLMLLGIANFALFLWPGEILFNYGIAGLLLFLFRRAQVRLVLTAAVALFLTLSVSFGTDWLARSDVLRAGEQAAVAQAQHRPLTKEQTAALEARADILTEVHPSRQKLAKEAAERTHFPSVVIWSAKQWVGSNLGKLQAQFLAESLSFMLLGVALHRMKVLTAARSLRFYAWMATIGYGLGLAIRGGRDLLRWNAGFEPTADLTSWGGFVYELGRLPTTLGLLGLVLLLYKLGALRWLEGGLKAIGRLALTNYVGQSVIAAVLFYGLGWYGRIGFAGLMALCVPVWLFQAAFSALWLRWFEMGPAEWLLRSLTYGELRPLRRRIEAQAHATAAA